MSCRTALAVVLGLVRVVGACSDDDGDAAGDGPTATEAPTTTEAPPPLRIMITNDDGVGAEGIDALVEALATRDDVEVVVVAPAENQSGSGDTTTDGALRVAEATTARGTPATAVAGFPADTVVWAIEEGNVEDPPDLVISGINAGQNLGTVIDRSGTVGAARRAAAAGIPALAVSQGFGEPPDYPTAVGLVMDWLDGYLAGGAGADAVVWKLNVPTCAATGEVRGVVEVPPSTGDPGPGYQPPDCASTVADPPDDVTAFANGFAPLSELPAA